MMKMFLQPLVNFFWTAAFLLVFGYFGMKYVQHKVDVAIEQATAPLEAVKAPIRAVTKTIGGVADGFVSLAEGYEQDKEQIHADFADALTETYYNFFPK